MNWFTKMVFNEKRRIKIHLTFNNWYSRILNKKTYLFCFKFLKFFLYFIIFIMGFCSIFLMGQIFNKFSSDNLHIKLGHKIYLKSPKNIPIERTIDIVMGADDGYIQHSAAAIASILLNCDASSNFRFHILDGGISSDKKEKLLKLKKLRNFDIQFYDMTKYDWSIFPDNRGHTTLVTYYRLLIPQILPKNIEKALYLDGDIIVEQDLKELWDVDISNYVLGAVEDSEGLESRDRLSLSNKYFNAGVLLLNLTKLREINLLKDSVSYLKEKRIIYQDQDILNGLFNNQYKDLPLKWNVNEDIYRNNKARHTYSDRDSQIAKQNPGIIHFTGGSYLKPWHQEILHPLSPEYWNYYKYTDFYSPDQRKSIFFQLILMHAVLMKCCLNILLCKS